MNIHNMCIVPVVQEKSLSGGTVLWHKCSGQQEQFRLTNCAIRGVDKNYSFLLILSVGNSYL